MSQAAPPFRATDEPMRTLFSQACTGRRGLRFWLLTGDIDRAPFKGYRCRDRYNVEVDVDTNSCFSYFDCLKGVSKSVQVLFF